MMMNFHFWHSVNASKISIIAFFYKINIFIIILYIIIIIKNL